MRPTTLRLMILTLSLAWCGWAEDYDADEIGRGVARVSLINGDVSVRRGDSGDWIAAAVNAPLVVEDSVLTGAGSRAEVQFDWANMVRLSANAEVRLAQLDSQRYILQIARGTVTFRVQRDSDAEVEISTSSVSVRPARRGSYRVAVREDGESEITVRSGEAEIFSPRGTERLRPGRTMLVRGTSSDPEFQTVSAIAEDSWDRWNEERDRHFDRTQSYRYADKSVYGADDLDDHGRWSYVAPYGWCWYPRVAVGWSPYYHGRWTWIDWYGWSWVSNEPWGWAPYHYGRWFHQRPYGWGWYPGGYRVRHHWRPALVAFFGWGSHRGFQAGVGVGGGWGHVGWVPLAPFEPYYPWYGRRHYRGYGHGTYIDNSVHIVNNVNITNIYRNSRIQNAVTAVDASQFGRGGGSLVRVSGNEVNRVGLVKGPLPVVPGHEGLRMANRDVQVTSLPRRDEERRFFSRNRPAPVERVPFEQQRRGMEEISRRTFSEQGVRAVEGIRAPEVPVRGVTRAEVAPRTAEGSIVRTPGERGQRDEGWRRFGTQSGGTEPGLGRRDSEAGWRRVEGRSGADQGNPRRERVETPQRTVTPDFGSPTRGMPRSERSERNESIRIGPPIVRERSESPRSAPPARVERTPAVRSGGDAPRATPRSGGESRNVPRGDDGGGRGGRSGRNR